FESVIVAGRKPAVLKGLVADWPLVRKGRESAAAAADYLQVLNPGSQVEYLAGDPQIGGRFSYNGTMTGENFTRQRGKFADVVRLLLATVGQAAPPALSIQALSVAKHLPELQLHNSLELPPPGTQPTIWIGNAITVAAHFDCKDNIACVAAGRRRFVLFPPEQLANLYVGPLHSTPQGVPISLVDIANPDLQRFPRFEQAYAAAQTAELEPGDALYIPYMWWHGVQSLAPFNILVNYWWNSLPRSDGPPYTSLMHAILAIASLPAEYRKIWQAHFEHFVFHTHGDPALHIAPEGRGVLGEMTPAQLEQMMTKLLQVMISERPAAPRPPLGAS
ncbi:MAG TPA: cupin-like domain-containing protein, partial [Steroidobacteraceae bacterium]